MARDRIRRWAVLGVVALGLGLQGCASIVSGSMQPISVETPGCEGARCEISNDKGRWFVASTPGSVTISRSYNNLQIVCTKGAMSSTPQSVASTTKPMAFGNILFGGVIGAGVDVGTGAAYDYPQTISVPMQCEPSEAATGAGTPAMAPARLGLRVVRAPEGEGAALRVTEVDADSPAARAGLRPGDLLLRANGAALPEPEVLATLVAGLREPWVLEMVIRREGTESTLRVEGPARPGAS